MADEHESPKRARPVMPAMPPFRGPGAAPLRAPLPLVPPADHRKAPPPFVGAKPSNGARPAPNAEDVSSEPTQDTLPVANVAAPLPFPPSPAKLHDPTQHVGGVPDALGDRNLEAPQPPAYSDQPPRANTDLPWLDTSTAQPPAAVESIPFPPFDTTSSEPAAPEEAAQALAGLPYFDGDGDKHEEGSPPSLRASGRMHRVESDPAGALERIAARVRSGELSVPNLDPLDGDAATLAAVLSALLRRRG